MRQLAVLLVTALLLNACYPPPPKYPPAPDLYYGAVFDTTRSTAGGAVPRQSDVLAKDAPGLLASGKTVAFLPPDDCATESVSPNGAQQSSTSIVMKCGALLASLEAEVAKAGYSVVSWQTLKSSGSGASQQRARDLNVDVLFEVNQLSQEQRDPGARQLTNLSFDKFKTTDQYATPETVSSEIAERCVGLVPKLDRGNDKEYLATINLKAVDVKSGRALWLYQNSVVELYGEKGLAHQRLFFLSTGTRPAGPEPKTGMTPGGVFLLEGILAVATGIPLQWGPSPMPAIGGVAIALGAVSTVVGIVLLSRSKSPYENKVPEPTYPPASEVLCVGDPVALRDASKSGAPAVTSTKASSSYSFGQHTEAASDPERERGQRLAQKITLDFVGALVAVAAKR